MLAVYHALEPTIAPKLFDADCLLTGNVKSLNAPNASITRILPSSHACMMSMMEVQSNRDASNIPCRLFIMAECVTYRLLRSRIYNRI